MTAPYDPYIESLKNEITTLRAELDALQSPIAYADLETVKFAIRDLKFLLADCEMGRLDQHAGPSLQIAIDALVPHRDKKATEENA